MLIAIRMEANRKLEEEEGHRPTGRNYPLKSRRSGRQPGSCTWTNIFTKVRKSLEPNPKTQIQIILIIFNHLHKKIKFGFYTNSVLPTKLDQVLCVRQSLRGHYLYSDQYTIVCIKCATRSPPNNNFGMV